MLNLLAKLIFYRAQLYDHLPDADQLGEHEHGQRTWSSSATHLNRLLPRLLFHLKSTSLSLWVENLISRNSPEQLVVRIANSPEINVSLD